MTVTLDRFPKTVSACHAEIIRLRKQVEDATEGDKSDRILTLEGEVTELEAKVEELESELSESERYKKEIEKKIEDWTDPIEAIENFLYQVERPVGKFKFDVIHDQATDRAIVRLFDAVERNP